VVPVRDVTSERSLVPYYVQLVIIDSHHHVTDLSSHVTPLDFYFCGYVRDRLYVPALPQSLPELRDEPRTETHRNFSESHQR
jgi:hypothetical protein